MTAVLIVFAGYAAIVWKFGLLGLAGVGVHLAIMGAATAWGRK